MAKTRKQTKSGDPVRVLSLRLRRRHSNAWGMAIVAFLLENDYVGSDHAVPVQTIAEALDLDIEAVVAHCRETVSGTFAVVLNGDRTLGNEPAAIPSAFLSFDVGEMRTEARRLDAAASHMVARSRALARTANSSAGAFPFWIASDEIPGVAERYSTTEGRKGAAMNEHAIGPRPGN